MICDRNKKVVRVVTEYVRPSIASNDLDFCSDPHNMVMEPGAGKEDSCNIAMEKASPSPYCELSSFVP